VLGKVSDKKQTGQAVRVSVAAAKDSRIVYPANGLLEGVLEASGETFLKFMLDC
jgi:hypothetical protein